MRVFLLAFFCCFLLIPGVWAQEFDGLQDLPKEGDSVQARIDLMTAPETQRIDVATYLLQADDVGLALIAGLTDAAKRGVEVRLIVDMGIRKSFPGLVEYMNEVGIQLRWHNPISYFLKELWNIPRILRANHRMHEKLFLVNGRQAVLGDKNYSDKFFFKDAKGASHSMRGKEIYVEGPSVQVMQDHFEEIWNSEEVVASKSGSLVPMVRETVEARLRPYREWIAERKKRAGGRWRQKLESFSSPELLMDTVHRKETSLAQIFQQIDQAPAGTKILIENSYFILFPELEQTLRKAIAKGCEIHVVLNSPEVADQTLIAEALRKDLPRMLEMGLFVHLNKDLNRTTHAKLVVIGDSKVIIGSTNIDPRSYRINSELSLMVTNPELGRYYWEHFESQNPLRRNLSSKASCSEVYSPNGSLGFIQKGPLLERTILEWVRGQL